LKRLALDEKVPFPLHTDPSFTERVELWAKLTHLDIRCPRGKNIQTLDPFVLGPGSFTFPKLQVLTLRKHIIEPFPHPSNNDVITVDPEAFLLILQSRMPDAYAACRQTKQQAGFMAPPEVRFVYTVWPWFGWALKQVEAFEALGKVPFGDADIEPALVERWAEELDKAFCTLCYRTPCTPLNQVLGQRRINTLLKEVERLDLEGRCSRILVVRPLDLPAKPLELIVGFVYAVEAGSHPRPIPRQPQERETCPRGRALSIQKASERPLREVETFSLAGP
jgi:hypothetical protein